MLSTLMRDASLLECPTTASKDEEYVCDVCSQTFRFKGNLKRHQMTKHVGLKPFQCALCPKTFARKADMQVHMRVHTGEKPYPCALCDKQFARISDLRSHERTHSGEKRFACAFPGCSRRFARKVDLRKHEFVHETAAKAAKRQLQPKQADACAPTHDHAAHARGCGHLSIEHGNHFDFIVNNQLVCMDGVKSLAIVPRGPHEPLPHGQEPSHGPGCGHLAVRHNDHVDYVVDNSVYCQHGGVVYDCDSLKLLDEDFWDFFGAVDSMTTTSSTPSVEEI
ncbi:hypothetical protein SDRG_02269 [Saprolegnia diclina VS20]|uniref:C2H2-type domain-containing protein n=1 Tax=Saprolegnia diclina (strain VS20) TaxID=1156394 RepID=T0R213_SAPDV|nr:hypothetical protein SDRG_02269 [Saprolegnia diclina VS20]EQC40370.1 hypothetical protein SDRG_02269 [Saprolegnia diclina VS20]|eukprot:XP_008606069.1 hypothetical protein SDRG_02269 [Saprolegnia diclina VS20]